jgi:hypothetical protein
MVRFLRMIAVYFIAAIVSVEPLYDWSVPKCVEQAIFLSHT